MVLLQNQTSQGSAEFIDVAPAAGVAYDTVGWGAIFSTTTMIAGSISFRCDGI